MRKAARDVPREHRGIIAQLVGGQRSEESVDDLEW